MKKLMLIALLLMGYTIPSMGQIYSTTSTYGNQFERVNTMKSLHLPSFTSASSFDVNSNIVKLGALAYNTTDGKLYYSTNGTTYNQRVALFSELGGGGAVISVNTFSGAITIANGSGISLNNSLGTITLGNTGVLSHAGLTGTITQSFGTGINAIITGNNIQYLNTGVTSFGGQTGAITATGSGISISNIGSAFTFTNNGVLSLNGNSGALTLANGTGIGLGFSSGTFTFTNTGVLSLNGSTGALTGYWSNGGNNFGVNPIIGTSNNTSLFFNSNNVTRGRLAETGEWIFGATTLTSGYHFQVKGYSNTPALFTSTQSASSGSQAGIEISPAISQTGTASYTAVLINPSETTVGSGTNYLLKGQVGGTDKIRIRNNGAIEGSALYNITTSNNASVNVTSSGIQLLRNVADASPAVVVQQSNVGSTGDIIQVKTNGSSTAFKVDGSGKTTIADGTQANGYIAVSDANGKVTWIDPTTITTATVATPSWDATLGVNPVGSSKSTTLNHTTGTHGHYLSNSGTVRAKYELRNNDASIALLSASNNSFYATGDEVTVGNGTNLSSLSSTDVTVKDITFEPDQHGGYLKSYVRYTGSSNNNTVIVFNLPLSIGQYASIEVHYFAKDAFGKVATGRTYALVGNNGGTVGVNGTSEIIPLISTMSGASCTIGNNSTDALVRIASGSGSGLSNWKTDIYYTIY